MSEKRKKFKFWSIVFLGINSIIGAGIFITPSKAYGLLGTNSLYILLLCAFIATVLALCFAEMAGKFSETGGPYVYVKATYGDFWGFQIGFIRFIVGCLGWGANMIAVPTALSAVHPWFSTDMGKIVTTMVLIIAITMINLRGVKSSEYSNNILTIIKLTPLVIFIVVGIFFIKSSNYINPSQGVPKFGLSSIGTGFLLLIYSFYGFENIGVAAQDMENPVKNIPKAILMTMIVLTIVFFFVYLNVIGILGSGLLTSVNPIGDSMSVFFGSWVKDVIIGISVISMIGYSLASAFASARNIIPLSKDHFMPEVAGKNTAQGVPGISIIVIMLITIFIVLVSIFTSRDTYLFILTLSGVAHFLQYIPVSLTVLKSRKLGIQGTFKLPFACVLVPLSAVISTIFLIYSLINNTKVLYVGVLPLISLSFIVWFVYSKPRAKRYKAR